jgi:hypothetical protein
MMTTGTIFRSDPATMKAVEIQHCQAGSVTSRQDGSVKISFVTPELRPSEAGALIGFHGKNCCVSIVPEDVEVEDKISVDTERDQKTPSQRWRAVLFVAWKQGVDKRDNETYDAFYQRQYEKLIDFWKAKLNP